MNSPLVLTDEIWNAACAHELAKRWRSVDPRELESVALELAHDPHLRSLSPAGAAEEWLRPVAQPELWPYLAAK